MNPITSYRPCLVSLPPADTPSSAGLTLSMYVRGAGTNSDHQKSLRRFREHRGGFCCPHHHCSTYRTEFRLDPPLTFIRAVFISLESTRRNLNIRRQNMLRCQRRSQCAVDTAYNGKRRSGVDQDCLPLDNEPFHKDTHPHEFRPSHYLPLGD
jgi:hypothetical protein